MHVDCVLDENTESDKHCLKACTVVISLDEVIALCSNSVRLAAMALYGRVHERIVIFLGSVTGESSKLRKRCR